MSGSASAGTVARRKVLSARRVHVCCCAGNVEPSQILCLTLPRLARRRWPTAITLCWPRWGAAAATVLAKSWGIFGADIDAGGRKAGHAACCQRARLPRRTVSGSDTIQPSRIIPIGNFPEEAGLVPGNGGWMDEFAAAELLAREVLTDLMRRPSSPPPPG